MNKSSVENRKRIVFIAGELSPFMELSYFCVTLNELLLLADEHNYEVRCILPKWGSINERRYRLHEVIRLSGLNVRIENHDYALEIKVASLPRVRLQVYFLGNPRLFQQSNNIYHDDQGNWYTNNGLRKIFFCNGVLQVLRKFGWSPDLIFCSHWISSLMPFYIKKYYAKEAVFQKAKIISTISSTDFTEKIEKEFLTQAMLGDNMNKADFELIKGLKFNDFQKAAAAYSDAVVLVDKNINKSLLSFIEERPDLEVVPFSQNNDRMEYIKLFEILT